MTYIIGEIGQNHNGSVELAKVIIDLASREFKDEVFGNVLKGMDAVKLTKRDLKQELSKSQMERLYDSPHSFGKTYGEHREILELNDEEHFEVYSYAKEKGLDFVETLCATGCLSILRYFTPDKLKVASRDLTNLPLLAALAETKIPIIVSTGMAGKKELDDAIAVITQYHSNLSILHCVSQYPTEPKNVNLNTIPYLVKNYKDFVIGYSDHTIGISTPVAAVAMGAKIIEKHITLDRRMKGTDQAGSLGPDGVYRMVRDIRILDQSMGVEDIFIVPETAVAKEKLERSIATKRTLAKGSIITEDDIHMLSPGDGFKWAERHQVIGKIVKETISENEVIYTDFLM
ncbi:MULTISPECIES: N-acetylneuraminate synthase family protein [unclassified Flavobacterium]|uniref:N-acetylneuraminate synthase family protein n=1 Tax=unclassified Flavobacterium TaxID=196869 RepID=UPI001290F07A|nr:MULTISPECIES: N-acetylneuraminate synthase family protein [unclassified Flavobacterium]MQP52033.1 shikimate dehydrogenase [Flavobacterium sp. LMO9]MQP61902.1 shikimate dehydrogenase [Flavobacterium sp. LMO6]